MENEETQQAPGVTEAIWNFFGSLKLAVTLLILIATASIIGTIIPQNPNQQVIMGYIEKNGEASFNRLHMLGLFDLYHQWWFLLLLALLVVNLTVCSLDRLPRSIRKYRDANPDLEEKAMKAMRFSDSFKLKQSERESFINNAGQVLSAVTVESEDKGAAYIFSNRGKFSRFGVYFVHLSIIVIVVGSLVGNILGFKGWVNIPEGTQTDTIMLRGAGDGAEMKLDFEVRCDDFDLETYPGTNQPKDFKSKLVVFQGGKEVLKKTIEVNDPLRYGGIIFYQSSYGEMGGGGELKIRLERTGAEAVNMPLQSGKLVEVPGIGKVMFNYSDNHDQQGGHNPFVAMNIMQDDGTVKQLYLTEDKPAIYGPPPKTVTVELVDSNDKVIATETAALKEAKTLPGGGSFQILDFNPDLQGMGPSITLAIDNKQPFRIFKDYPDFDKKFREAEIHFRMTGVTEGEGDVTRLYLTGMESKFYTGLQVAKDPGVSLVWAGCIIMFIGLYLSFFMSHRKIWVRVGEDSQVVVAGATNRNPMAFENKFRDLVVKLKQHSTEEK